MRVKSLVVVLALLTPCVAAQSIQDEIAFTRAQIQADRQAIVAATLELPEAKGEAFWPMYRQYRAAVEKNGDRVWSLLTSFSEKYESLSDADASPMLKEWLAIEKDQSAIRQKWAPKFSKVIGPAYTARFFQIEHKLDSIVMLEATGSVPLARPATN